jgi:hypothetical protein
MLRWLILVLLPAYLASPALASLKDLSHCDPLKKDARNIFTFPENIANVNRTIN